MKLMTAIRDYVGKDGGKPVSLQELKDFKDACLAEDRKAFVAELTSYGYEIEES